MCNLFAVVAGLVVATSAVADDPKPKAEPPAKKKPEPTLKVGDKAPVLKADKWVNGAEVKQFEAGQVYVVEFWAQWCGPCITMMPHLADLADEYKAKGVTVVGFNSTAKDKKDLNDKFVEKRGPKLGYTFAWEGGSETDTNWMKAAGRGGIPCSFVVGKDGTLAYIGHPMYLDIVLPKVLAGATAGAIAADVAAAEADWVKARHAMNAADPADGLKVYAAIRPEVANIPYLTGQRLGLMVKAKQFAEAQAFATAVVAKAGKRDDASATRSVAEVLSEAKDRPELVGLAVTAADAYLKLAGDDDEGALLTAAAAYSAAGREDAAREFGRKAVGLVEAAIAAGKTHYTLRLTLARAYAAAGEPDKAKAAAQKALDAAPAQAKEFVAEQVKKYGVEPKADGDK